ncbi:MAG TPA: hypothetical protein VLQ80_08035 [Candidatus Saccharimonadia bacterium]|nr:hypothetical protein [Candidatus Saccharimonadia bacterium]
MEPSRGKSLCVPFESEEHYAACVAEPASFRQHLTTVCGQHPELFPASISEGFVLHDKRWSLKQQVMLRRLERKATAAVFLVRPSFLLPSMVGRTAAVAKALYLRHWGVPFDALAYVCGRDAMYWYRTEMALGRPAIVGSTVKQPEQLPQHVLADEKHTWALGHEVYVATTVGGGCILGATVTEAASADALEAAYGAFAEEARALSPTYSPTTVCTDGWEGTQSAWRRLFPTVCIMRCFLHSVLKIAERCGRDRTTRTLVLDRVWAVYASCTRAQFSQRLRRLREWATAGLPEGALRQMVLKLCGKGPQFVRAYRFPGAHRTSNALDRLMNHQDRRLYAMGSLHGTPDAACLAMRAMALEWNFHPYGARTRRNDPTRCSPFHDLNGFEYHPNWLHNLLIASSMGGRKL